MYAYQNPTTGQTVWTERKSRAIFFAARVGADCVTFHSEDGEVSKDVWYAGDPA